MLHTSLRAVYNALARRINHRCCASEVVDEQLCSRCGRLDTCMSHHIENALVAVVTDARYDGKRKVGHILCQRKRIESRKVARSSTATYYHHHVEAVMTAVNAIESGYDAMLNSLALHRSVEEFHLIYIMCTVVGKLSAEVAIACRPIARHHSNALSEHRQGEFALKVEHSFGLQLSHYLLTSASKVAHCIFRIDVADYP